MNAHTKVVKELRAMRDAALAQWLHLIATMPVLRTHEQDEQINNARAAALEARNRYYDHAH